MTTSAAIEADQLDNNLVNNFEIRAYPQLIKYMGSKAKIIKFVSESIASVYDGGVVSDLFSGACSLSGALGATYPIHSNDIQHYSALIASVYLKPKKDIDVIELMQDALLYYKKSKSKLPMDLEYSGFTSLEEFNQIEELNRTLINKRFRNRYHLFLKNYSGTWWSAEQCIWIDAIKQAIDKRVNNGHWSKAEYAFSMACLMHAMAYCSQGTGHYAQYRDAKSESSMEDINIYRQKRLEDLFVNKFSKMQDWAGSNVVNLGHKTTTLDYMKCLRKIKGGTVYADPPYAFVHYSRFYHAMETLCLYDYPDLQIKGGSIVKGRYREERHQSPFCIRTQVEGAFEKLFSGVKSSGANLALSYSDTAMITLNHLLSISKRILKTGYDIWVEDMDHQHMTMGRRNDRSREVKELILLARKKPTNGEPMSEEPTSGKI